jgi:hypothetical protein
LIIFEIAALEVSNSLGEGVEGEIFNWVNPEAYLTDTSNRYVSGREPRVL